MSAARHKYNCTDFPPLLGEGQGWVCDSKNPSVWQPPPQSSAKRGGSKQYTRETLRRSRSLRSNPTEAEKKLWRYLRGGQLEGFKFRRQFFISEYIADFVCVELKLVIEADGGQHNDSDYDSRRYTYIRKQGYQILRFWNNDVLSNIEGVMEIIRSFILRQTPPRPSPKRGGSSEGVPA